MVDVGEEAPDFTLPSDSGDSVSLRDFRGKKGRLVFLSERRTSGGTREAKEFRDLFDEFKKENAVILGVSKDSVESHRRFKEKHNLPFILLSDTEAKVLKLYGVWNERHMYGRRVMGTERTTFLIDENGIVRKVYRKVKVKGHVEDCLLDLRHTASHEASRFSLQKFRYVWS